MKYRYFISYNYRQGIDTGLGSSTYTLDAEISVKNFMQIVDFIKKENNFDIVVILNFILLEKAGEEDE